MKPQVLLSLSFSFLFGCLSPLSATSEEQLTLKYTVEGTTYTIAGFEENNPYALVKAEKTFPKAGGTWSVQGDLLQLAQFGFLLDDFRLYKNTQSFKERDLPPSFKARPNENQSLPVASSEDNDAFLYWDSNSFKHLTILYAWIDGKNQSPAQLINWDQIAVNENQQRYINAVIPELMNNSSNIHMNQKKGFPVFWFLDRDTQKLLPPQFHQDNIKGRLNWLIKSNQPEAFRKEWAQHQRKIKYKKGEVTPLHLIALYQQNELLTALPELETKFIKSEDDEENTPAHYAAFVGNFDFFNRLTKPEKAVNLSDKNGFTPLHQAIFYGHTETVDSLIQNWELQNQPISRTRTTPLILALGFNRPDLLNRINHYEPKSIKLEPSDFNKYLPKICMSGNLQAVEFLLSLSSDPIDKGNEKAFLTAAILSGNPDLLQHLLTYLDPIPENDPETHLTYLHLAAMLNEPAMIPVLIDSGISINATTSEGKTPLFQAITNNNFEATLTLLDLGADPDIFPPDSVSAIWAATFNGNIKGIDALLRAGATCNLEPDFASIMVEYATLYDIPQVIQIALDQCLPEDYQLHDEFPGIYVADYFGSKQVVQFLESKGQSLNAVQKPLFSAPKDLDNPIKFIHQSAIDYPKKLSDKYGTLETNVHAVINKAGFLILPKLSPPLPSELTKRVRETLKTWQIEPPTTQGNPTNISVSFALKLEEQIEKEEIFELSQLSIPPKPIRQDEPIYPSELIRQKVTGGAVIEFVVLEDGSTDRVRAKESTHPEFADAAIKAVKKWKFQPGIADGKAVKTRVFIRIPFDIR